MENVLIAIHDSNMRIVDYLDNMAPKSFNYKDDGFDMYADNGSYKYTFTVDKFLDGELNPRAVNIKPDMYFSFMYDGEVQYFNVLDFDDTGIEITVTGETLNLALLYEKAPEFEADKAYKINEYISIMGINQTSKLEVGYNELADAERKLVWTGESTVLERVQSLVTSFDGEYKFRTTLNQNGEVDTIYLDIYKRRTPEHLEFGIGHHRKDVVIHMDKYGDAISSKTTKRNLFNAMKIIDKDGNYFRFTKERSVKNEEGRNEIVAPRRSNVVYAPLSMLKYPSLTKKNQCDNWIEREFKTEYTTIDQAWTYAVQTLQKYMYPEVTYTIPLHAATDIKKYGLKIGDTIYFSDPHYFDKLILMGRITAMHISFTDPTKNTITLSNFIEIKNKISKSLKDEMNEMKEEMQPVIMDVSTTGVAFVNGTGDSLVTPTMRKGSTTLTENVFYSYYINGVFMDSGATFKMTPDMLTDNSAVLTISGMYGSEKAINTEVTFTNTIDGSDGKDGVSLSSVDYYYLLSNTQTGVSTATAGWTTTITNPNASFKYLWAYRVERYSDSTEKLFNPYILSMFAKDGASGADGLPGKDGKGMKTPTELSYALSTNQSTVPTTWKSTIPTLVKGQYLWTKELWTYTDDTQEVRYSPVYIAKDGNNGTDGIAGKDGTSVKGVSATYASSTSGTVAPTSGWSTTIPNVTPGNYLWTKNTYGYSDDTTEDVFIVTRMGNDGVNGKTPVVHTAYANKSTSKAWTTMTNYPNNATGFSGSTIIQNGVSYTSTGGTNVLKLPITFNGTAGKHAWVYFVIKNTHATNKLKIVYNGFGATVGTSYPTITLSPGESITVNKEGYCRSTYDYIQICMNADTNVNDSLAFDIYDLGLYTTQPFVDFTVNPTGKEKYIGTYSDYLLEYSTDTSKYTWSQYVGSDGLAGKDGVGVQDTRVEYGVNLSPTEKPTSWSVNVASSSQGDYVWTRTTWIYTDNTQEVAYQVSRIGKDGSTGADGIPGKDGTRILSTVVTYASSTSGTVKPTTWSATIPTVPDGQFLWTRMQWNYSDTTSEFGYSVGKMGSTGATGTKGADGVTYYPHIAWAKSADGATGFSTTNATGAIYMGAYTDSNAAPSTDYKKYTWALFKGKDGLNGERGLPGPAGTNTFTHVAWAESITGLNMNQNPSPTRKYLGMYVDTNQNDSPDPIAYKWTKVIGEDGKDGNDGAQGIPGRAGTDGKTPYFHRAWANSADGTIGFSTTDSTNKRYLGTVTDFTLADPTNPSTYKWTALFENVESGGMNLISNTKDMSGNLRPNSNTKTEYLGYTVAEGIAPAGGHLDITSWNADSIPTGNTYIVSFYAKSSATNTTMASHFYSPNTTISSLNSSGYSSTAPDGLSVTTLTTDWKRYWIVWKQSATVNNKTILIGRNSSSNGAKISIAGVAMFTGNSQKEWMPSMNDLYSLNKIGGVNLLRNSQFKNVEAGVPFTVGGVTYNTKPVSWATYNGAIPNPTTSYHTYVDQVMSATNVVAFNESNGTRNWKALSQHVAALMPTNSNDFVFSFDYYATGASLKVYGGFYYYSKSKAASNIHAGQFTVYTTKVGMWDRLSVKVPFDYTDCDFTKPIQIFIYSYGYTTNSILYMDKLMLENGTIPSAYKESDADIRDLIDTKANDAEMAQQINTLNELHDMAMAELEAKANSDQLNAVVEQYNKLMDDFAKSKQASEKDFIDLGLKLVKVQNDIGNMSEKWSFIDTYMSVQNEGIVFSNNNSSTAIKISEDRISMLSGGTEVMSISQGMLVIDNGIFSKSIRIGHYIQQQYYADEFINTINYID